MSEITNNNELTEEIEEEIDDAEVMQVPIDDTLSISGEAADAKAVGDALALKADKSELQNALTVNGQSADSNGNIQLLAEDIPMSSSENAKNVAEMIQTLTEGMEEASEALEKLDGEAVKSVNGEKADGNGNVAISQVPFAQNLTTNVAQQQSGAFLFRPTAGHAPVGDGAAELLAIFGRRIHTGESDESRGTITTATPSAFRSTGWNLYNHTNGYAKVTKYSEDYGFKVSGTYTTLQFSSTIDGDKTTITPEDGEFTIEEDGYVWVTGGNNTDTAIYMTWSDWTEGYSGSFAVYREDAISLSSIISSYFPYGLGQVGAVCDEIAIHAGYAIRRIDRMAYSAENLATAEASGRAYECDEDYIYIVLETPLSSAITLSGSFTANDHGTEIIDGSSVPVYIQALYGQNLVDKLRTDVLTISEQTLTDAQKAQILENIGVYKTSIPLTVASVSGISSNSYSSLSVTLDKCGFIWFGKLTILKKIAAVINADTEITVTITTTDYFYPSRVIPYEVGCKFKKISWVNTGYGDATGHESKISMTAAEQIDDTGTYTINIYFVILANL